MLVNLLWHFRVGVENYLVNELRDDGIEEIDGGDLLFSSAVIMERCLRKY